MLAEYEPFHNALDLDTLMAAAGSSKEQSEDEEIEDEPYNIKKIVKKRFNGAKVQFEYRISSN
jgi:hypothetical protein